MQSVRVSLSEIFMLKFINLTLEILRYVVLSRQDTDILSFREKK